MGDLTSLIERIEAATGPDRILDIDVFREIGAPLPTEFMERKIELEWDETDLCFVMPLDGMRIRYEPPFYTASIDAVLTLLPDGFKWKCGYSRHVPHNAEVIDYSAHTGTFIGESDASRCLALLAAILRARQAADTEGAK